MEDREAMGDLHVAMLTELQECPREAGAGGVLLLAGGSLLREDIAALRKLGIEGCFPPGTPTDSIITFIRQRVSHG